MWRILWLPSGAVLIQCAAGGHAQGAGRRGTGCLLDLFAQAQLSCPALVLDRIASALVQCVQALQQRVELGNKVVFWRGPL